MEYSFEEKIGVQELGYSQRWPYQSLISPSSLLSDTLLQQGMIAKEIFKKQGDDLLEMKMTVKNLTQNLKNLSFPKKLLYDDGKTQKEFQKEHEMREISDSERIALQMLEIKKFDSILNLKSREIKMAKIERLRDIVESQQILKEALKSKATGSVRQNLEEFLKLLEINAHDHSGENIEELGQGKLVKREKLHPVKKRAAFIERNIQLAKCGDGVLSLTDEEKLRLKIILRDLEEPAIKCEDQQCLDDTSALENQYILNEKFRIILEEIDRKLEEHKKTKFSLSSVRSSISKIFEAEDNLEKKDKMTINTDNSNEFRLKEVNKLLNCLNTTTNEEIEPLPDEDLQYLINKSKQSLLQDEKLVENHEGSNAQRLSFNVAPPKETMINLISSAKAIMPNFKFRYKY